MTTKGKGNKGDGTMTRMEGLKKYGASKQCPVCRSCQTFERTDEPGTHRCLSCNHEWTPNAPKPPTAETVDERLDRLEAEYQQALNDDVPAPRAKEIMDEMGSLVSSEMGTVKKGQGR